MSSKKKKVKKTNKQKWTEFKVEKVDMTPDETLVACPKAAMTLSPTGGCCNS